MNALVLSGGGVLGALHLGALHRRSCGTKYQVIAGTSIGAIVGVLLAVGYEPLELLRMFVRLQEPLVKPDIQIDKFGAASQQPLVTLLERLLKDKCDGRILTLREMHTHFGVDLIITGTNMTDMRGEYFHRHACPYMSVLDALRITSCVPLLFPYVEYNDRRYVDGFVTDNFPLAFTRRYVQEHYPDSEFVFHAQNITHRRVIKHNDGFQGYVQALFNLFLDSKKYEYGPVRVLDLAPNPRTNVSMMHYTQQDIEQLFNDGYDYHLKNTDTQ
jgi:predicted acylesterase/phospholipase RssA